MITKKNILKTLGLCSLLLASSCATLPPKIIAIQSKSESMELTSEYNRAVLTRLVHPSYNLKVESADNLGFNDARVYDFGRVYKSKQECLLPKSSQTCCFYRLVVE